MKMNFKSLGPVVGGLALVGGAVYGGVCLWQNRAKVKAALNISGAPPLSSEQVASLMSSNLKVLQGSSEPADAFWLQKARKVLGSDVADAVVRAGYFFTSTGF